MHLRKYMMILQMIIFIITGGVIMISSKGILERYKKYNGQEGNSPTSEMSTESYPTTGSTLPDMEDINRDNTLSETESYYQYKVSMRKEDIRVGTNFIVDEIEYEATMATGKSKVKWYQFKIPITDYQRIVGPIRILNQYDL
jgi:cell surface protein SprA